MERGRRPSGHAYSDRKHGNAPAPRYSIVVARRVLWVLLCLVAGGPCAFLALEGIWSPIIAVVLVAVLAIVVVVGKRNNFLPETLIGFGLTYSIEIARFAVGGFVLAVQENDLASAAYFAAHLAVAGAIVLSGCWMLLARDRAGRASV